jgi:fibronectin-binding autotransporter adhesin
MREWWSPGKACTLFVWTAGNGSWSGETNWLDNARPVEGGPIRFAGPGGTSTNNSLASIASLAFTANANGSYTLEGGNLTLGAGGISNDSQHSQTIALNLAFSEDQTFAANSANLVVIGNITGAASLTKTGSQSLVLSGANALSGNTTVFSGELAITGGSLATHELQIGNGGNGTLHLSGGAIEAAGSLIALFENTPGTATVTGGTWNNADYLSVGEFGIGTLNLTGGSVSVGNGTGTLDLARQVGSVGTLNIGNGTTSGTLLAANVAAGNGAATVNFHHDGSVVFFPVLTGNLALNQLGTGTTTLAGNSNHSGATTVSAGILLVDGSLGTPSAVSVAAGATLGGNGTVGGEVALRGTLSPGTGTGSFSVGRIVFDAASILHYETNSSANASAAGDLLVVAGDVEILANAAIQFSDLSQQPAAFAEGTTLSLVNYGGTWNGGTFSLNGTALGQGGQFTMGLSLWTIDYAAETGGANFQPAQIAGKFINITAVPEPSAWALLALATATLAWRRTRKP